MSDKPTPGPWFTSDRAERPSESGVSIMAKVSGEEVAVAECWVRGGISLEAAQANARQLAASGEAVALLRELYTDGESRTGTPVWLLKQARAVLRKVDGEAPASFGKWVVSEDGEMYSVPEFDSEEEAIMTTLARPDLVPGQVFWVGQTVDPLDDPGPADADPEWAFNVVNASEVEAFEVECGFKGCGAKTLLAHVKGGGLWTPKGWSLVGDEACCPKPEHWTEVTEPTEVKP